MRGASTYRGARRNQCRGKGNHVRLVMWRRNSRPRATFQKKEIPLPLTFENSRFRRPIILGKPCATFAQPRRAGHTLP